MDTRVTTFHGRVYGNKVLRKTSDLPDDLTNASAATRRVFEPVAQQSKRPAKDKRYVTLQGMLLLGVQPLTTSSEAGTCENDYTSDLDTTQLIFL